MDTPMAKDDRSSLADGMQQISDRLKAGESADDILDDPPKEPEAPEEKAVANAEIPSGETEDDQDTEEIEAAEEAVDKNAETGEPEKDESASDDEGDALKPPAFWSKEQTKSWEAIPDEHKPSAMNIFKGMEKTASEKATELDATKRRVEAFDAAAQPYAAMLQADGATPELAFSNLLNHAAVLRYGTPKEKQQKLRQMATDFGIEIESAEDDYSSLSEPEQPTLSEVDIKALVGQELQQHTLQNDARAQTTAFLSAKDSDGNPLHPHFDKLAPDIASFINSGHTLDDAYDRAVRSDPELYKEAIAGEVKAATTAKTKADNGKVTKARGAAGVSLSGTRKPKAVSSVKDESTYDTLVRVRQELSTEGEQRL
jgi:hypothetical protein